MPIENTEFVMNAETDRLLEECQDIVHRFDDHERVIPFSPMETEKPITSVPYRMLAGRLERAVLNQAESGAATVSRYAIWAETVRGLICGALTELEEHPGMERSKHRLIQAANSLAAFSEIQARFDSFRQE